MNERKPLLLSGAFTYPLVPCGKHSIIIYMDIKALSDTELKAMAYDIIAELERNNKNLQIINAELESRRSKPEAQPSETAKKK